MNVQDSIKMALEVGIDTTGPTSRGATGMEGIKTVSSDEIESFRAAFKQYNENSKTIIFDVVEEGAGRDDERAEV